MRRCKCCNKELPDNAKLDVCSLCKVGLMPIEPGNEWTTSAPDPVMVVQGRKLSGILCPMCKAELTQADTEKYRCSLCDEIFSP